jgi:hypothetical protein
MVGTQANDLLSGSAIILGMSQMIINMYNVKNYTIDKHTYTYLYLGIVGNFLWLTHQYRNGSNYSAMYSTVALFSQIYILYKVSSKDREISEMK